MKKTVSKEELDVQDAVDHLTKIADLNVDILLQKPEESNHLVNIEKAEKTNEKTKASLNIIHSYLKNVYSSDQKKLKNKSTQKGIEAIMTIANEASEKVDQINTFFHQEVNQSIKDSTEYKGLEEFYSKKIQKRFKKALDQEDYWIEEFSDNKEDVFDLNRLGLKDLETVKQDLEYELFYLKKEDGRPFFNRNLLRHIKLVTDFDELITHEQMQDPFIITPLVLDRSRSLVAKQMLSSNQMLINSFIKGVKKYRKESLSILLYNAILALLLAANPANRLEETHQKNSMKYFEDFQVFMREILLHEDYYHLINNPPEEEDHFAHKVIKLIQCFCYDYFHCEVEDKRTREFLHNLLSFKNIQKSNIWSYLIDTYDYLKGVLKHHPNGPLMKAIDYFKDGYGQTCFDSVLLGNHSYMEFELIEKKGKMRCLHMPSPTHQSFIQSAEPSVEFLACLQEMDKKREKFLLFNLQDRTSWKEFARCECLEKLQYQAEYKQALTVITIPKYTAFYKQSGDYLDIPTAKKFLDALYEHIETPEACGFYFPKEIELKDVLSFTKKALSFIHTNFFGKAKKLSRQNRLDFIEIYYVFLIMHLLASLKPDSFSFSCKDAIDVGALQTATLYSALKVLAGYDFNDLQFSIEKMCFLPALFNRERLVNEGRFHRMISALSCFETGVNNHKQMDKELKKIVKNFDPNAIDINEK